MSLLCALHLRVTLAAALVAGATLAATSAGTAGAAGSPKLTVTKLAAHGTSVGVRGRATLPKANAAKRTRVALSLADAAGTVERFSAKLDAKRAFRIVHTTKLTGTLTLEARLTVAGKPSGRAVERTVAVAASGDAGEPLVGTFRLTGGTYSNGKANGTYFRMKTPRGAYLSNYNSTAGDQTYTLLVPGSDGGLTTGHYQENPDPPFDANGGSRASRIIKPARFFGVSFSVSTQARDPQTGLSVIAPSIVNTAGVLSGDLRAWSAQWNTQYFNQGSPKPDGSSTGFTRPVNGIYESATRKFELEWSSHIVGGPFNDFGGEWHLEGTFVPTRR